MPTIPQRVADLPLPQRPPRELLHLTEARERPDTDFDGFGWGRLDAVVLREATGREVRLRRPLVIAVHSADEPSPDADHLELQFELRHSPSSPARTEGEVDGRAADHAVSVIVPLAVFLRERLGPLLADNPAADVVLAMCNPQSRALEPVVPSGAGRLWWAHGDVDSWLDRDDASGRDRYVLTADRWTAAEAA